MEKKIHKKKNEIADAQAERARRKVLYDSQIIIIEGQRKTIQELEARSTTMLNDFVEADKKVSILTTELNELAQQLDIKEEQE